MARILVVEDEGIVARDIRHMLEALGHSVLGPTASGEEAVALARESRPDLVLMDIVLRGRMNGIDAAEGIRSSLGTPVVYLTAYADETTLQRAKGTGPFGYVLKPFDERELHTAIEIALFRHRVERSLKESEAWLTITLRSIGDAVIVTDQQGAVLLINRAAEGITGWSEAEARGREATTLLPMQGEDPGFEHPVLRALREGGTLVLEDRIKLIAKDGTAIWIGDSVAPIKDDQGAVKGSVVVFRDITRRRQAEAAQREAERRYRDVFENAIEGMFQSTPEGRILMANPAAARILGYDSPEELVAAVTDVGAQTYLEPERRLDLVKRLEEHGSVRGAVLQYRRRDGTPIWVSVSARVGRDGNGGVLRYDETVVDITEQRRAEEAEAELRQALERAAQEWERTFDSIEAPILLLDGRCRIVRLNRAAKELSGEASYQQLVGRGVALNGAGQPWEKAGELASEVAGRGMGKHAQVRDDSSGRTWDITVGPALLQGQDERVIVVARDITPLVELQESLRRSETMSVLGSVVGGVAHEVRNPLFGISSNLDAFEARFGDREEYAETIAALREGVNRLVGVMNELLEYGKPFPEAPTLERLAGIVTQAVESCSGLARSQGVEVVARIPAELSAIAVDRDRIVRVFQNLIENATQHTPSGGKVGIEAQEVNVAGQRLVECSVMDSGAGFREEDLPRIFEPFFTRRHGGTGLGLSIVQRIVELHGGSIAAANRAQGGAMVTVRIPASSSDASPPV